MLRILRFPSDIIPALGSGDINIQEAPQLARLSVVRMDCTLVEAAALRRDVLVAHLTSCGSQNSLRAWVKEILGEVTAVSTKNMMAVV
ncbi:MAG: hypothetical protein H0W76_15120 [Pyrinomonadaceae bacterium]|nr:hypothetical protein [Pyrinomonadaceae bacterium]